VPATRLPSGELSGGTVFHTWWPLAASWLLMGCELPLVSAVIARLPHPTVNLAAYGGVVFPLALLIESPIIMLLSASVALSCDRPSYRLLRRCMLAMGGTLTALHVLIAFTPLYGLVVDRILGAPAEVLEPARTGLRIMTPWTLSIAYRRFQQGVLIRSGRTWAVGVGTAVRLGAGAAVLAAGWASGRVPGIVVGTLAVIAGVVSEAVFSGLAVRPVLRGTLPEGSQNPEGLTLAGFARFYVPLALTPLLSFIALPMASAAMGRMPLALESLAAWPVVNGLVFVLRSTGFGLNEVVISLLEQPRPVPALRRFSIGLGAATSGLLVVVAATPLGPLWFEHLSALPRDLANLAGAALGLAVLMPAFSALQSWYQGAIVYSRRTRAVTESMALYLATIALVLAAGMALARFAGLPVVMVALTAGSAVQVGWLRLRAGAAIRAVETRPER